MRGFRAATIRGVLRRKVSRWIDTIDDKNLQILARSDALVCGGAVTSLLVGEAPNDYDVYFRTMSTARRMAEYYAERFNNSNHLASINNYKVQVRTEKVENIKGEVEDRVRLHMQSAGAAGEGQEEYKYFEGEGDSMTERFFESIKNNRIETAEEISEEVKEAKKEPYRPVFLTDNAITLANKVQLIIRFYGEAEEIHKNFDFVHALNYYDVAEDTLNLHPDALTAILSRNLMYVGSLYPLASMFRVRKFLERGWRISAGQMLKIAWQINELDLDNPKQLQEQLIGVDQAYMRQLVSELQSVKPGTRIDSIYLAQLVDRIFE